MYMLKDREFSIEFIRQYKSLPALWDTKCPDYDNPYRVSKSYVLLLVKYTEKYGKSATVKQLKRQTKKFERLFWRYHEQGKEWEKENGKVWNWEHHVYWYKELSFLLGDEVTTVHSSPKPCHIFYKDIDVTGTFYSNGGESASNDPEHSRMLEHSEVNARQEPSKYYSDHREEGPEANPLIHTDTTRKYNETRIKYLIGDENKCWLQN